MKKLTLILTILTALFSMNIANANSIVLTQNAHSFGNGGEFTATTSDNGTFETFCIETSVEFVPWQPYTYNIANTDNTGRNLTQGAALLYHDFIAGTLMGYDYNNVTARYNDAGLLQSAIWYFQGQASLPLNDPFYTLAINELGDSAFAPDNGQHGVQVLQLWNGNTPAQNQLISVPDTASTAFLLFIACGLIFLPRNKNEHVY